MSSGYLLDTSILSLLAPGRLPAEHPLLGWIREHHEKLYLSAVTVAEIEQGFCKLRRLGASGRAEALKQWLDELLTSSADRVLPFDARAGRIAGERSDRALAAGRHPGFADVAIAATALSHGLLVLTHNGKHFEALGVAFSDPVVQLPDQE